MPLLEDGRRVLEARVVGKRQDEEEARTPKVGDRRLTHLYTARNEQRMIHDVDMGSSLFVVD